MNNKQGYVIYDEAGYINFDDPNVVKSAAELREWLEKYAKEHPDKIVI